MKVHLLQDPPLLPPSLLHPLFYFIKNTFPIFASIRKHPPIQRWVCEATSVSFPTFIATLSKASTEKSIHVLPIKCATPHPQLLNSRARVPIHRMGLGDERITEKKNSQVIRGTLPLHSMSKLQFPFFFLSNFSFSVSPNM